MSAVPKEAHKSGDLARPNCLDRLQFRLGEDAAGRLVPCAGTKAVGGSVTSIAPRVEDGAGGRLARVTYEMTKSGREAGKSFWEPWTESTQHGGKVGANEAAVLTDIAMPEMNGFTATRGVKSDRCLCHIPAAAHTPRARGTRAQHWRGWKRGEICGGRTHKCLAGSGRPAPSWNSRNLTEEACVPKA